MESTHSIVANVLDYDIVVSGFELQSTLLCSFEFMHRKYMSSLISAAMG